MFRFIASLGSIGVVIMILGVGGWIANIVKMVSHLSDPITAMEILRMIGIVVAPLGAVLGYC